VGSVIIEITNLGWLCCGAVLSIGILAFGHWGLHVIMTRIQTFTYGTVALIAGFTVWASSTGQPGAVVAFTILAGCGGAAATGFYWLDGRFGWKKFPNTTPDRERIYELEKKTAELELANAKLAAENAQLRGTPMAVAEFQRQEIVASLGSSLEIMAELSQKLGIAWGHMSTLQGVMMNKAALNMSFKQQREVAKDLNKQT
jgi:hypothetical protein